MIDLLLTHGYFLSEDATERRIMKPYPPLGILSLSAYLKRQNFSVEVFDSTFETLAHFRIAVQRFQPNVVGVSINMMTKFNALKMIRIAREHGCRVVIGGPETAFYAEEFLAEGADVVVIGEGEMTLKELLYTWNINPDVSLHEINGLVFMGTDGNCIRTAPREKLASLDALPLPDRDAIDIPGYGAMWKAHHGYSSISVITQRGCPYSCTWCSHAVYGESYRRRSPSVVVDELEHIVSRWQPDMIWFADDVFTISHRWLFELEKELQQRGLHIRFECITRADRLNADVIRSLKRMGCKRVWIGAESGSQRILDAMNRGVTVEQVIAMTRKCRDAGIEVGTFIMLGYAGETKSDIEATIRYLQKSKPDIVLTTVAYPIKGTRFYEAMSDRITIPTQSFNTWNDRDIAINGRFSKRFYWFAHRRIVNETEHARLAEDASSGAMQRTSSYMKSKIAALGMLLTS